MFDFLASALFGAGTGGIGLLFGFVTKAFTWYAEERQREADHRRVVEMTKLQHDLRSRELEIEREITLEDAAARLRQASYSHDSDTGKASKWVINTLRLVRPVLTGGLIVMLGLIYFTLVDLGAKQEIVSSMIYMAVSSVTWWFGDRMTAAKK